MTRLRPRWSPVVLLVAAALAQAGCTTSPSTGPAPPTRPTDRPPGTASATHPTSRARLVLDPRWGLTRQAPDGALDGWTDRAGVLPGQPVGLHVSTSAPTWTATAYRMGWYGAVGGAKVWQSAPVKGTVQAPATLVAATRTVQTSWPTSLQLQTRTWPPGAYLIRLDSKVGQRFIPFTVRSPVTRGRVVLVNEVTTWQAYNDWGGYNLYHGRRDYSDRSVVVSFDRPYSVKRSDEMLADDLPTIARAERIGIPAAYATDVDVHADPHLLDGAAAVVFLSHDEYWSLAMRQSVTRARDAGVNVAFLGANNVFRHIRLEAGPTGPDRLEVNFKGSPDPLLGHADADVTVDWREPPVPRPESDLTGVLYACNPVETDMVVTDPSNWLYAGTPARTGLHLTHIVGYEYDRVNLKAPRPARMEILPHSPVRCEGRSSFSDSVWYTVPSGAGVFASGSIWFTQGLPEAGAKGVTAGVVAGMVDNLLRAFAAGPAGRAHPAVPNVGAFYH
ncbi:N,N-dimethylformamidase beta subunit family domain-containing protein [Terrabacter lapilli]|uniref:N,N-dimethylformamidase beta subunit family domain-containing protein n=1 Tax=Terrabacter lapilli TaxID=436231 RepID=UPI0031D64B28